MSRSSLSSCRFQMTVSPEAPTSNGATVAATTAAATSDPSVAVQVDRCSPNENDPAQAQAQLRHDVALLDESDDSEDCDDEPPRKSPYRHVPHAQKLPHVVEKRNARERRRVEAVNGAFIRLRRHVPHENRHKRLSKVKTLRIAIDYIHYLRELVSGQHIQQTWKPNKLETQPDFQQDFILQDGYSAYGYSM